MRRDQKRLFSKLCIQSSASPLWPRICNMTTLHIDVSLVNATAGVWSGPKKPLEYDALLLLVVSSASLVDRLARVCGRRAFCLLWWVVPE